ncbi:MAG: gamma-glutamyl-gamma-aminobutyrate hydrolase family protein [Nitrospirae bacterium]|nr:gamma-glutamyl-gamma-aminobutyrate hydrolase family protein [Nitrospirota bacterium]
MSSGYRRKPVIGITADMDDETFRLRQEYVSAVVSAGGLPLIAVPAGEDAGRIAGMIDGLLVSGGDDLLPEYLSEGISVPLDRFRFVKRERTEFELRLLEEILNLQKPVLAVCYGMQLLNVALGGTIFQDIELQLDGALDHRGGRHAVRITGSFGPVLRLMEPEFMVNSFHHQAVRDLGQGLKPFAVSEDGIIEGIYGDGHPFLAGVQWHPERTLNPESGGVESTLSRAIFEGFIEKARK